MNNNNNANVQNVEPTPGTSRQEEQSPLAKRKKSESEGNLHVDKTISTIVDFFRAYENRNFTAIQDGLMPLLLANFKPDKKRVSLDFTQLGQLPQEKTYYYIKMLRSSTSIKFNTAMFNRTLFDIVLTQYKNLDDMFIILNPHDHLRDLHPGARLKLRRLRVQGHYNQYMDPVKNLLNITDNGLVSCSLCKVKVSEVTMMKLRIAPLTNISLYDIVFENINAKTLLMSYVLTNNRLKKLKLVSRQETGPSPFFRDFAINFLKYIDSPRPEMKRITFTVNQDQAMTIDMSNFPNIKRITFYYTPIGHFGNLINVVTQIKTLIDLREISPKKVQAIEYIQWEENIAAKRIVIKRSSAIQSALLQILPTLKITSLNFDEADNINSLCK